MAVMRELELTKQAYHHFRNLYPGEELCISVNQDKEVMDWVREVAMWDLNLKWAWTENVISFGENYNKAVSLATKDKIVLYHNDMIPAPGFLENLDTNEDPMFVLGYTTVEPPVFPDHDRPGKIIQEFGREFNTFEKEKFQMFASQIPAAVSDGTFFFLSCFKKTFDEIGGFDEKTFNTYFCEDDDLILRLLLHGCQTRTTSSSVVYHLVSKTSRFSNTPFNFYNTSVTSLEMNSQKNFIRKWGGRYYGHDNKKVSVYDIGYNISHGNENVIAFLEPFAKNIKVDCSVDNFIRTAQPTSTTSLSNKFVSDLTNQVIVHIDGYKLNQTVVDHLLALPKVLPTVQEIGKFKYSEFTVEIRELPADLADTLIVIER